MSVKKSTSEGVKTGEGGRKEGMKRQINVIVGMCVSLWPTKCVGCIHLGI